MPLYPLVLTEEEVGFLTGMLFVYADPKRWELTKSVKSDEIAAGLLDKLRALGEGILLARKESK